MTTRRRDPERTRAKILDAAARAFSKDGLAGARIDEIARRAGVNKRMLYHYFGSKEGLFKAVVADRLERKGRVMASAPADPEGALVHFHASVRGDPDWVRFLMWEALQTSPDRVIGEAARRKALLRGREQVEALQTRGLFAHADTSHLMLSLMAMVMLPYAMPQLARLITGHDVGSAAFARARDEFFRALVGAPDRDEGGNKREGAAKKARAPRSTTTTPEGPTRAPTRKKTP